MYKRIYEDGEKLKSLGKNPNFLLQRVKVYLTPFTNYLYSKMDVRLVRTFHDAFVGILAHSCLRQRICQGTDLRKAL